MSFNQFAPQSAVQKESVPVEQKPVITSNKNDQVSNMLVKSMRLVVLFFIFSLPVFFLPGLWATLSFQKSMLAIVAVSVTVMIGSLLLLRNRRAETVVPIPVGIFAVFIAVSIASALASSDIGRALRGSVVEVQTVTFSILLLAVMCIPLVLQHSKRYVFYACAALGGGLLLLLSYTLVRLVFGPVLAFQSFPNVTQTPMGNLNDLALIAGLTIIMGIITLMQLRLRTVTQAVIGVAIAVSLLILAVVNFLYVWLVVGFFAMLILLYLLSYDSLFAGEEADTNQQPAQFLLLGLVAAVCLVSGLFIIAGDSAGSRVAQLFDVEYLEVRPSLGASIDIAQGVYGSDLLLGVGPNQFEKAWREFKNPAINQTLFWNTDFVAGSGLVSTFFVTLGLLGGVAFVLFHLSYLWLGIRTLLRPASTDSFWYFAGILSFVGAVFLWGMTYVYVPGATVLLLAATLTGLSFAAMGDLQPATRKIIPLVTNHKRGFVMMAIAIVCITTSMFTMYSFGEQYVAQASFNKFQQSATTIAEVDQSAFDAFATYPDARFLGVRSQVALLEMNRLLAIAEPTEADQQRFVEVADLALRLATAAIQSAPGNPEYHAILAGVYNNYALAGIEGAQERSAESLAEAKRLDPRNPSYDLMGAQMAAARGDVEAARSSVIAALQQKPNFAQALLLLAEIDIAEGNIDAAIETTRAIITLEPQNPARYYQLGILLTAAEETDAALVEYGKALERDPNFANARYLRALLLIDLGQTDLALEELRLVAQTNADNTQLQALISSLESGDLPNTSITPADLISDAEPTVDESGVTSPVNPDTDLITPLNTVSQPETSETEINVPAQESGTEEVSAQEGDVVEEVVE